VLNCELAGFISDVVRGINYVINRTKFTGRKSVVVLPLAGLHNNAIDVAAEKAVRHNIVLVAAAGE